MQLPTALPILTVTLNKDTLASAARSNEKIATRTRNSNSGSDMGSSAEGNLNNVST
jgi:hypothetical protein